MKKSNQKGFTLVELLVAVGIIGVLASVSLVSINSVRQKSRDAKRISEIKQMQNALEAFMSNNGSYPQGETLKIGDAATNVQLCANDGGFVLAAACTQPLFMQKLNRDPLNGVATGIAAHPNYDYVYKGLTAAGAACPAKPCENYSIGFALEGGTGSLLIGAHKATPNGLE